MPNDAERADRTIILSSDVVEPFVLCSVSKSMGFEFNRTYI
jgi:hypothetical protein